MLVGARRLVSPLEEGMTKGTIKALLLGSCLIAPFLGTAPGLTALEWPQATVSPAPYPYNIYFGDLHVHTSREHTPDGFGVEFSRQIAEEANRYARDEIGHDFVAITNHDYLLEDWMWGVQKEVADDYTQNGVFISFPAYEHTNSRWCAKFKNPPVPDWRNEPQWGHRNVYYRSTSDASLLRCNDHDYDTPEELFLALPEPSLVTTVPHHTSAASHPFDWTTIDWSYDRSVEIIQMRGSFEEDVVQNGRNRGHILGVVGGGDNHHGLAGAYEGITAISAPALTRDALFDGLAGRRTYATTRGDVLLHFFGDGDIQGTILSPRNSVLFGGDISSRYGDDIASVEFLEDGVVVDSWSPNQPSFRLDKTQQLGWRLQWSYFYVRVTLANDHKAWSSPIWVEGYRHKFFPFAVKG
jgi:hypothetical protein